MNKHRTFDKRVSNDNHDGVMADSLRRVRDELVTTQRPQRQQRNTSRYEKPQYTLCHPSDLGLDGVDHINVSPLAETHLGVFLHPTTHTHFSIPFSPGGGFASIQAYSNFLSDPSKKASLKGEYGNRALASNRELRKIWAQIPNNQRTPIKYFKFRLARAAWIKVKSFPEYCKQLAESTLPFRMYGWNEDKTARVSSYDEKFWIDVFEEIRRTLLRGVNATPNFDFVIPGRTTQDLITEIETKQMTPVRTEPLDLGINNPVKKRKPRPEVQTKSTAEGEVSEKTTANEVVQSSVVSDSLTNTTETFMSEVDEQGNLVPLLESVTKTTEMEDFDNLSDELVVNLLNTELPENSNSSEPALASRSDE